MMNVLRFIAIYFYKTGCKRKGCFINQLSGNNSKIKTAVISSYRYLIKIKGVFGISSFSKNSHSEMTMQFIPGIKTVFAIGKYTFPFQTICMHVRKTRSQ